MQAARCHDSDRDAISRFRFGSLSGEILQRGELEFLAGPWRDPGDVVIDDVMAKSMDALSADMAVDWLGDPSHASRVRDLVRLHADDPVSYGAVTICRIPGGSMIVRMGRLSFHPEPSAPGTGPVPIHQDEAGRIIHSSDSPGLVAFASELAPRGTRKIVGLLAGCDLVVKEAYRRQGIGRALVVEKLFRDGEIPVWNHDKPSYSRAGAATVLSARRAILAYAKNHLWHAGASHAAGGRNTSRDAGLLPFREQAQPSTPSMEP